MVGFFKGGGGSEMEVVSQGGEGSSRDYLGPSLTLPTASELTEDL